MEETFLEVKIAITPQQVTELGGDKEALQKELEADLLSLVVQKLYWRLKK